MTMRRDFADEPSGRWERQRDGTWGLPRSSRPSGGGGGDPAKDAEQDARLDALEEAVAIVEGDLEYCGLWDASTGLVATVSPAGAAKGFVVGEPLPPAVDHQRDYLIVSADGPIGSLVPVPPTSTATPHVGDWVVSDAVNWRLMSYSAREIDHGGLTGLGDDDHPQYLTEARGDQRYDTKGAASAGDANHIAAADPHPQYLTQAEGDALFLTPAEADALFLTPAEGDAAYVNIAGDAMTGLLRHVGQYRVGTEVSYWRDVGMYAQRGGSPTGAIVLAGPDNAGQNRYSMTSLRLVGMDYKGGDDGAGSWQLDIAGYIYNQGDAAWYSPVRAKAALPNLPATLGTTIRVGRTVSDSRPVIILGTETTDWGAETFAITELLSGYLGYQGEWADWTIRCTADLSDIIVERTIPIEASASTTDVSNAITAHEAEPDPHPQYAEDGHEHPGSGANGKWDWSTNHAEADPGNGKVSSNGATWATTTEFHISRYTALGNDAYPYMEAIDVGDVLTMWHNTDSTCWAHSRITAIQDNGTWFKFTVTVDDWGTEPTKNQQMIILVEFSTVDPDMYVKRAGDTMTGYLSVLNATQPAHALPLGQADSTYGAKNTEQDQRLDGLDDMVAALESSTLFVGTFDAATGLVASVTTVGAQKGYVVGQPLPDPVGHETEYLIVAVQGPIPANVTPIPEVPEGDERLAYVGDWIASGQQGWILLRYSARTVDHGTTTGLGDDDHPQYLTNARGDARYDPIRAAADGDAAHVAAADPHPQYMTQNDSDTRYVMVAGDTMTGPLSFVSSDAIPWTTDRIALFGDAGSASGYGLGIEPSTLYYRANELHRWYIGGLADNGATDKMELSATGLTVNGTVTTPAGQLASLSEVDSKDAAHVAASDPHGQYVLASGDTMTGPLRRNYQSEVTWHDLASIYLASGATGAVVLTGPADAYYTMATLRLSGYDYGATVGVGSWAMDLAGYLYDINWGSVWLPPRAAKMLSPRPPAALSGSVRLGYVGSGSTARPVVIFGDVSTLWNEHHIHLDDLALGYSGASYDWSGWSFALRTDLADIIVEATVPVEVSASTSDVSTAINAHVAAGDPHSQYVNVAGDAMTGPLTVAATVQASNGLLNHVEVAASAPASPQKGDLWVDPSEVTPEYVEKNPTALQNISGDNDFTGYLYNTGQTQINGPDQVVTYRMGDTRYAPLWTPSRINLALENGWTAFGSSWGDPAYTIDPFGVVRLQGLIKGGNTGRICVLPAGARVAQNRIFLVQSGQGEARVDVVSNGEVNMTTFLNGGSNAHLSLDGISFVTGV